MFDDQNSRNMLLDYLLSIDKNLSRIADALEQFAPPKVKRPSAPADIDRLTAPTLEDLARWEREDKDKQPPIL